VFVYTYVHKTQNPSLTFTSNKNPKISAHAFINKVHPKNPKTT
jgi:hypothetical protein